MPEARVTHVPTLAGAREMLNAIPLLARELFRSQFGQDGY
jgi:hypothetical protein